MIGQLASNSHNNNCRLSHRHSPVLILSRLLWDPTHPVYHPIPTQAEVQYIYDGKILMLIPHIPVVSNLALLSIFHLHPFPKSFNTEMALTVLAMSMTSLPLATSGGPFTIELINLMNCHLGNSVYACERHSVPSHNTKSSCLRAQFENALQVALTICDMELNPHQEYAPQMESNWFLVHRLKMFTNFAHCKNGSVFEIKIRLGVSKILINPACSSNFQILILISDLSLQ